MSTIGYLPAGLFEFEHAIGRTIPSKILRQLHPISNLSGGNALDSLRSGHTIAAHFASGYVHDYTGLGLGASAVPDTPEKDLSE
jgi:hypothetical protein